MRHGFARVVLVLAFLASAGCQDYNFNPVGRCLLQPGSERVTLSSISSADVLFVVDDSGSMLGEQQNLGRAFGAFIANLDQTNAQRVARGLQAIDFHVAATSSSVFRNPFTGFSCANDCSGSAGTLTCCNTAKQPLRLPRACTSDGQCSGGVCSDTCTGYPGERVCCTAPTGDAQLDPVRCATAGERCGALDRHFRFTSTCDAGNATDQAPYPQGAFVGLGSQPRVLHFDKSLYPATPPTSGSPVNSQGFTAQQLVDFFAREVIPGSNDWQGNVIVGTCGSGQEQHLEAGRRAIQKAVGNLQRDTYQRTSATPTPAAVSAEFVQPQSQSKLVLVFVGDEDDCTSPEDPVRGVVFQGDPGADACFADTVATTGRKQTQVSELVDYFFTLNRPVGAAFIVSTAQDSCQDEQCTSDGTCCDFACTGSTSVCSTNVCGGQARSIRLIEAAAQFRGRGADVVVGSMCDPNFDQILSRVADIVKPPRGLVLPTEPAASEVTVLRIAAGASTRKTCVGPAPAGTPLADAIAGYDWWFTATRDQVTDPQLAPVATSRFVYINLDRGNCIANPGETYSADYLGRIPAGGCTQRQDCASALGGDTRNWACTGTAGAPGTCICCATGSTDPLCTAP